MWQVSQQLADLFCAWYDELDLAVFHARIEAWSADPSLRALSDAIERDAERAPSVASPRMRVKNGKGDDPQGRIFAALRGLDRVFAQVVPSIGGLAPDQWADVAVEVAIRSRLDSGEHGGMLLPRLVTRSRLGNLPEEPREAFTSVLRVSPEACKLVRHTVVPIASRPHRRDLARGLVVGCTPFVQDPDELRYDVRTRDAGRFYRIAPQDVDAMAARIDPILDAWVEAGVQIALVPELMLCPRLLEVWRRALRAREDVGALRLVLVGSGSIDGREPPANTAVLLDARSGEEVGRQDKLFGFNMDADQIERFGLEERLGMGPIDEDLARGEHVTLLDLGGMRIAILVCEDLNRVEDLARPLREFGVSHLLVPVFARALKDRRWERNRGDVYVGATGATIVIANSLVVASLTGTADADTALVNSPGIREAVLLRAADAADVAVATLHGDGNVTAHG